MTTHAVSRSAAIWVVALALAGYGMYAVTRGVDRWQGVAVVFAALALVAATGLVLERSWSQYLVHAVTIVLVGSWLVAVWSVVASGRWPYPGAAVRSALSLLPGVIFVAVCVAASLVVYGHFRGTGRR